MATFRRLFYVALCAGLIAGAVAAIAHHIGTVPLIRAAENFERAAQHGTASHEHGAAQAWEPEDGIERTAYTLVADLLAAIGFALLLAAGLMLADGAGGWRAGLWWGLAGFAALTVAPALGLPPELPGTEAAPLAARQLWWLATAAATGGGLALLAFTRRPLSAVVAVILLALPHLYGAPQPIEHHAEAPAALAQRFATMAMLASLLFWATLGSATGYFHRRFAPQ
jgi:cobalt transporter subunit CbtA